MQWALVEVVINAGGVLVTNGDTGDTGEDLTRLNIPNAVEVDASRRQSASPENR